MQAISVDLPIQASEITTLAAIGNSLFAGDDEGKITKFEPNSESIAKPFVFSLLEPLQFDDYKVAHIATLDKAKRAFALLTPTGAGEPKIVSFNEDLESEDFVNSAYLLSATPKGSLCEAIVYATGTSFVYCPFPEDSEPVKPITVDIEHPLQYVAVNDQGVAYYANSRYCIWYKNTGHFVNVSNCVLPHGMIASTSDSFVFCMNMMLAMSSDEGMMMSNPVPLSATLTGTRDPPTGGFFFGETLILFYPSQAITGKVSYKRHENLVAKKWPSIHSYAQIDDIVYFASGIGILQLGGMTDGMKLGNKAIDEGIEIAINQASSFKPERLEACITDFFKTLWEKEKFADALQVVATFLWKDNVKEILSLFPFFVFQGAKKQRTILSSLDEYNGNSLSVFEKLGSFLTFTLGEYRYSHDKSITLQLPIVETALFEFYAMFHQTRDIDMLMSKDNSINEQAVTLFFNENLAKRRLHPSLAVYFAHTERAIDALNIWKSLNDSDKTSPKWALEAAYTLQGVEDKMVIEENLTWICARSKSAAIQTFLHPDVDITDATKWIKKNTPHFMIKFLDYLTEIQKSGPKLAKEALDIFSKLLGTVRTPEFRVKAFTFSKYYEKWKKNPVKESELEETEKYICDRILGIARMYPKIDLLPYCKAAQNTGHTDLMFDLFKAGEMYSQAMDELVCNWTIDYQRIKEFCRSCPTPHVAFRVAIEKLIDQGQNILQDKKPFILDNIEYIAYDDILRWLPDNVPFSDVVDIFTAMERTNVLKRNVLKVQKSTLESLKTEMEYNLTKQEIRWVEINYDTVCESCKRLVGNGFVSISNDGKIYHLACKPRQLPTK